jgi:hypothetical protein
VQAVAEQAEKRCKDKVSLTLFGLLIDDREIEVDAFVQALAFHDGALELKDADASAAEADRLKLLRALELELYHACCHGLHRRCAPSSVHERTHALW